MSKLSQVEITPLSNAIIRLQADLSNVARLPEALEKLRNAITELVNLYQNSSPDFDQSPSEGYFYSIKNNLNLFIKKMHLILCTFYVFSEDA